jgi:hypothetical protein
VDCRTGLEVYVLVQQTKTHSTRTHDVATIGRLFASDETKDRALTGAVSPYESDVFTGINLQGRASQHVLNTIGLMNF